MLQRGRIVLCSDVHAEHIELVAWQNVEFASVKAGGIYSNRGLILFTVITAACFKNRRKCSKSFCGQNEAVVVIAGCDGLRTKKERVLKRLTNVSL
jgi:hypothetical protein